MTINKSRNQKFKKVGVSLTSSVFSHGQLYVAFTRVSSELTVKILLSDNSKISYNNESYTQNILFHEIL